MSAPELTLRPITLRQANAVVAALHRHHKPARGCQFCVSVVDAYGVVRGVAIAGRPVARARQDGVTIEVSRCATDGSRNACSMLYGATVRAARALGYRRWQTYTLPEDGGASLRAIGARCVGEAGGGSWDKPSRPRRDAAPLSVKLRWEITLR